MTQPARDLVLGLGNPLMGDDGVGCVVAELLARQGLPGVEVRAGGTDLLAHIGALEGRRRVVVVDARLSPESPGRVEVLEEERLSELCGGSAGAHALSVPRAVALLRLGWPKLDETTFVAVTVGVSRVCAVPGLSAAVEGAVAAAADAVRRYLEA